MKEITKELQLFSLGKKYSPFFGALLGTLEIIVKEMDRQGGVSF